MFTLQENMTFQKLQLDWIVHIDQGDGCFG